MADSFGLKIGLEGGKEFKKALSEINQIWLNTNIQAHSFISPDYWQSNFDEHI